MKIRKIASGVLFVVLVLPMLLALLAWVLFYGLLSLYALNRTNGALVSSGKERDYLLHVPKGYDGTRPTPLVISLHGAMNWPAFQMKVSRWNAVADEHGFIVVYPAGSGVGPREWSMRGARTPLRMPEVRFVSGLIDKLQETYNIDPSRIYANGLSHGGFMAFVLSCTLSHRIAAIGAVAAAQTLPSSWCASSKPVPMIAFHGTADSIVPYHGGKVWIAPRPFPDVSAWVADWARRNRCGTNPVESEMAVDVSRREYTGCAENATVVLYTVEGGGHTWPGGDPLPEWMVGSTTKGVDATRLMWAFFREHPLPGTR